MGRLQEDSKKKTIQKKGKGRRVRKDKRWMKRRDKHKCPPPYQVFHRQSQTHRHNCLSENTSLLLIERNSDSLSELVHDITKIA